MSMTLLERGHVAAILAVGMLHIAVPTLAAASLGDDRPLVHGPLSVTQAVQAGLQNSLSVMAARSDVLAARAETRAARAMTLPQLSANTYATVGTMPSILGTTPGVLPANALAGPPRPFADQNLTLMVAIYTGGRLGNLLRAASGRERAASAAAGAAANDAAYVIKEAYYRSLLAAEMVKVAHARVDASGALAANARALFEAGKGIAAQVSRAEAETADARRMLATAQNDQTKALLDLKRAMGVQLESDVTLSDSLSDTPPSEDVAAALKEAARLRPELTAARARTSAARALVSATKGSLSPQIYGTAMTDAYTSSDIGSGGGYTAGLSMSIPLVDAGQRRAETAQADAARQRADAELRDAELMVAAEVREAWLDVDTAARNLTTARAALTSAEQAYDVTALRVQNQKGIQVEVLDAITALTQARSNVAQALYDHSTAVARLQRAVGRIQ